MNARLLLMLTAVIVTGAGEARSQALLSVADTSSRPADTLAIPLTIQGLSPADSIFAVEATIASSSPAITVVGVESAGTLSAGASALYFPATSKLAIAFTTPITSNGTLIKLKVIAGGTPGSTYTIQLSGMKLNEGTPAVTGDNGSLYLRYLTIQPHAPTGVVLGDTIQFSVTGNPVQPLTWSTNAPGVGSTDSTGSFIAIAEGVVRVRVVDAEGKQDSTAPIIVLPSNYQSLTTSIPDTSQTQTLQIGIPIRVSDVTGLGIVSAQFTMAFNTTYLEYLGVSAAGTMTEDWNAPVINANSPGVLVCALAGTTELSGGGTLLRAIFRVKSAGLVQSNLTLSNVQFNEDILSTIDNGTFLPLAAPTILVVPERYTALKGEVVNLVSTTGGTGPYTYVTSSPTVASVDSVDGTLTVLTRGPVQILVTDAQGFPGSSNTIHTFDFVASLPDTAMLIGDSLDVPLRIGNTTGLDIVSFQFRVLFDTAVVEFRGAYTAGSLSQGFSVDARDSSGRVSIAGAGITPLSGTGDLLYLRFASAPGVEQTDSCVLTLDEILFNEPGISTPAALPVVGSIRVLLPNTAPAFVSTLPDTSLFEGDSLGFMLTAVDAEGDTLTFRLIAGPPALTIDSSSGFISWATTYTDSGTHLVTFAVSDGEGEDSATATVTVVNVNRAPAFALVLPDTTIREGDTLVFTFIANDPDGDEVHFMLTSGSPPGSIDSVAGVFTFAASFSDAGDHSFTVVASDGGLSDSTTATVTVLDSSATAVAESDIERPNSFDLGQNYPNPFNPSTTIGFALPVESNVTITIFNILGEEVVRLLRENVKAGYQTVKWHAQVPAGVYFYRISAKNDAGEVFVKTRRMVLLK